jgi:hypothetical protein
MLDVILIIWVILFLIFFASGIMTNNAVFSIVSGMLLLLLGLGIISSGLQMNTGMTMTVVGGNTNITYSYSDVTPPFSSWGLLFGLSLLSISIYIIYRNAEDLSG